MKKNLQSRLSKYTAAATAVVGAVAGANGQVVYTDINPDEVHDAANNGGPEFGLLDLNNDATLDFFVYSIYSVLLSVFQYLKLKLSALAADCISKRK